MYRATRHFSHASRHASHFFSITLDTMKQFITQNYGEDHQKGFDAMCQTLRGEGSATAVEFDEEMFVKFFLHSPGASGGRDSQNSVPAAASDRDSIAAIDAESEQEKKRR